MAVVVAIALEVRVRKVMATENWFLENGLRKSKIRNTLASENANDQKT